MNPRVDQLRALLEHQLYVIDERRAAEAILARARVRATVPGSVFAQERQSPLTNGSTASFGLPGCRRSPSSTECWPSLA